MDSPQPAVFVSHPACPGPEGMLKIENGRERLLLLVERQLGNFFEYSAGQDREPLLSAFELALQRVEHCFHHICNKYYRREGALFFSPFHSGQYSIFLYYLARSLAVQGTSSLADRVYYLNRALNSLDLYHQVVLPDVFFVEHPLGSVIGRAEIGDGFYFAQHVTVGGNKGHYPVLGRRVSMLSGSKVVGRSRIGDNVTLAANAYVKDCDVPSNSLVFGQDRDLCIKPLKGEAPYHHLFAFTGA